MSRSDARLSKAVTAHSLAVISLSAVRLLRARGLHLTLRFAAEKAQVRTLFGASFATMLWAVLPGRLAAP